MRKVQDVEQRAMVIQGFTKDVADLALYAAKMERVVAAALVVVELEFSPHDSDEDQARLLAKYPPPQVRFYEALRDALASLT